MYRKTTLAIAMTTILTPALLAGCSSKPGQTQDYAVSRLEAEPAASTTSAFTEIPSPDVITDKPEPAVDTVAEAQPATASTNTMSADEEATVIDDIAATLADYPEPASSTPPEQERPALTLFRFDFDKKELSEQDQDIIRQHGEFLAQHPDKKIQLHGHADAQGDPAYNQYLATQRANHVASLLMEQGVRETQIEIFSWGSDKPLAEAQQWQDNRRVELFYDESLMVQAEGEPAPDTAL